MNIEEIVNNYLQERRHEVLLNPYNGLIEFSRFFLSEIMGCSVEGTVDSKYWGYKVIHPNTKQLETLLETMEHGDKVRIIIVKEN